jgi:hypothetical protein
VSDYRIKLLEDQNASLREQLAAEKQRADRAVKALEAMHRASNAKGEDE